MEPGVTHRFLIGISGLPCWLNYVITVSVITSGIFYGWLLIEIVKNWLRVS
jgi:hypothetical protein